MELTGQFGVSVGTATALLLAPGTTRPAGRPSLLRRVTHRRRLSKRAHPLPETLRRTSNLPYTVQIFTPDLLPSLTAIAASHASAGLCDQLTATRPVYPGTT